MITKVCRICGDEKSLGDFYPSKSNKDRLSNLCKRCDSKGSLERSRLHEPSRPAEAKHCRRCLEHKAPEQFFKRKASPDGLARLCKACDALVRKARKNADPDKERAYQKEYRLRNLEKKVSANRDYYVENKTVFLEKCAARYVKNKDLIAVRAKRYYSDNKSDFVARAKTRKISKRKATPAWASLGAIRAIYRECERISMETGVRHHVDHVVPLQSNIVCGLHWEGNLQILCGSDNIRKGNRYWPDMP